MKGGEWRNHDSKGHEAEPEAEDPRKEDDANMALPRTKGEFVRDTSQRTSCQSKINRCIIHSAARGWSRSHLKRRSRILRRIYTTSRRKIVVWGNVHFLCSNCGDYNGRSRSRVKGKPVTKSFGAKYRARSSNNSLPGDGVVPILFPTRATSPTPDAAHESVATYSVGDRSLL